jgi:hypothetical protein
MNCGEVSGLPQGPFAVWDPEFDIANLPGL